MLIYELGHLMINTSSLSLGVVKRLRLLLPSKIILERSLHKQIRSLQLSHLWRLKLLCANLRQNLLLLTRVSLQAERSRVLLLIKSCTPCNTMVWASYWNSFNCLFPTCILTIAALSLQSYSGCLGWELLRNSDLWLRRVILSRSCCVHFLMHSHTVVPVLVLVSNLWADTSLVKSTSRQAPFSALKGSNFPAINVSLLDWSLLQDIWLVWGCLSWELGVIHLIHCYLSRLN